MDGIDLEIAITKFVEGEPKLSQDEPVLRLVCETSENKKIVFWGSHELGTRNIDALKNQKLPVFLQCQVYKPSDYLKREYGVVYTVPEHSWISINPEV